MRGTICSDKRLDLCKQVIGPQGIEPLMASLLVDASRFVFGGSGGGGGGIYF